MLCEMGKREHHRSEVRKSFTLTYAKNIQEFKLEFAVSSDKLKEFKGPTRYEAPGYYRYQVQWQAAPFPGRTVEPDPYPYPFYRYDYVRSEDGITYSRKTDVQIREPPFSGNWPTTSKHYGLNMGYYAKRGRSFLAVLGEGFGIPGVGGGSGSRHYSHYQSPRVRLGGGSKGQYSL